MTERHPYCEKLRRLPSSIYCVWAIWHVLMICSLNLENSVEDVWMSTVINKPVPHSIPCLVGALALLHSLTHSLCQIFIHQKDYSMRVINLQRQ